MSANPQQPWDHAESTMDPFVTAGVAVALQMLEKEYCNLSDEAEKDAEVDKAIALFDNQVKEEESGSLTEHWGDLKNIFAQETGRYDRVGSVTYPLKKVFALVYLAAVDRDSYEDKSVEAMGDRIATLFNAVITLHQEKRRCHQGIRNDLVGTLSHVYRGLRVLPPRIVLQQRVLAEYVNSHLAKISKEKRREYYISWVRESEMPAGLAGDLRSKESLSPWYKKVESDLKEQGANEKNGISQALMDSFINGLKKMINEDECFLYCEFIIPMTKSIECLRSFYHPAFRSIAALQKAAQLINSWVAAEWVAEGQNKPVVDYVVVRITGHILREHMAALLSWNADRLSISAIHQAKKICGDYAVEADGLESGVPQLRVGSHAALARFNQAVLDYKQDQRVGYIENYFANYFAAELNEKKALRKTLADPQFAKIVMVDAHLLDAWKNEETLGEWILTPYRINRILFTALMVDSKTWSEVFAASLKQVIDFISRGFDTEEARGINLKEGSYPPKLMCMFSYLFEWSQVDADASETEIVQLQPERRATLSLFPFLKEIILAHSRYDLIGDINELCDILKGCDPSQQHLIFEVVRDQRSEIINTNHAWCQLFSAVSDEMVDFLLESFGERLNDLAKHFSCIQYVVRMLKPKVSRKILGACKIETLVSVLGDSWLLSPDVQPRIERDNIFGVSEQSSATCFVNSLGRKQRRVFNEVIGRCRLHINFSFLGPDLLGEAQELVGFRTHRIGYKYEYQGNNVILALVLACAGSEERRNRIFEAVKPHLHSLVRKADDLVFLAYLNEAQITFILDMFGHKLTSEEGWLNTPEKLGFFMGKLKSGAQIQRFMPLVVAQLGRTFGGSKEVVLRKILSPLPVETAKIVLQAVPNLESHVLFNPYIIGWLLKELPLEHANVLVQTCREIIRNQVQRTEDLVTLLGRFFGDDSLVSAVANILTGRWRVLLPNASVLHNVLNSLNGNQRIALLTVLSKEDLRCAFREARQDSMSQYRSELLHTYAALIMNTVNTHPANAVRTRRFENNRRRELAAVSSLLENPNMRYRDRPPGARRGGMLQTIAKAVTRI